MVNYEIDKNWEKARRKKCLLKAIMKIKNYDLGLYNHSVLTGELALMIAETMKEDSESAFLAGLYHDYGKILIPKTIVNKPGMLNEVEIEIMQKHSIIGYSELRRETDLQDKILIGILDHHERYDGSGYGYGKYKEEISLLGRIVALADVFTAITAPRIYRKEIMSYEEAADYLSENKDKLYDKNVVEAFLRVKDCYINYHQKLDSGYPRMKTLKEGYGIN